MTIEIFAEKRKQTFFNYWLHPGERYKAHVIGDIGKIATFDGKTTKEARLKAKNFIERFLLSGGGLSNQ